MRTTAPRQGLVFGKLGVHVRGRVEQHISPYAQRPFAGAISHGLPNIFFRVKQSAMTVGVPLALGYLVYCWGEKEHARLQRKQPGQFDHEK